MRLFDGLNCLDEQGICHILYVSPLAVFLLAISKMGT